MKKHTKFAAKYSKNKSNPDRAKYLVKTHHEEVAERRANSKKYGDLSIYKRKFWDKK